MKYRISQILKNQESGTEDWLQQEEEILVDIYEYKYLKLCRNKSLKHSENS